MRLTKPTVHLLNNIPYEEMLRDIEYAARISTKTDKEVGEKFVSNLIKRGHYSVLRHAVIHAHIVCSRRVSHEFVRHHVGIDLIQESTRWCCYAKDRFNHELTVYLPKSLETHPSVLDLMEQSERVYNQLIAEGYTNDDAGYVLPHSLKTEMVVVANVEAWRTVLTKRLQKNVLKEFRDLMEMLRYMLLQSYPVLFEDLADVGE